MKFSIPPQILPVVIVLFAGSISYSQSVKPLIETEAKFGKTLQEIGLAKAFYQFFADSSIVFAPTPVNAKQRYAKSTSDFKNLYWEPEMAEISAGGDFGYTTGPWKSADEIKGTDTTWSYGHYITVWQKFNDEWKALYDGGISYNDKYINKPYYKDRNNKSGKLKVENKDLAVIKIHLIEIEKEYAAAASEKGEYAALGKFADGNVRLNREGNFPVVGIEKSVAYLKSKSIYPVFSLMNIVVAPTGDFAFSYGTGTVKGLDTKFNFMKIWKFENNKWKIVLDVMLFLK